MKFLSFLAAFIFFTSALSAQEVPGEKYLVLKAAELSINGETNVNSFSCTLRKSHINDTLASNLSSEKELKPFEGLEISFQVEDFACGMEMITEDFRECLKAKSHPQVIVKIEEIEPPDGCDENYSGPVKAKIRLYIATAEREQIIDQASIHQISQKTIFTGSYDVLMTSFNLEPPSRLFGSVQTNDQIEVQFSIQLEKS